MNMKKPRRQKGVRAWLVTWEHSGDHAKPTERVAAVLNPRLSGRRFLEIVELLYSNAQYDPSERIEAATSRESNPYKAQFGSLQGVPWDSQVICGHNPWLEARLVSNLRAEVDATGQERFVWDERPVPVNQVP